MDLWKMVGNGVNGFSNAVMPYVGWLLLLAILFFVWGLITTHRKGLLYVLAVVFLIVPAIAAWAPGLWMDAGISGTDSAQLKACARWKGAACNGLPGHTNVAVDSSNSSGGGNTGVVSVDQGGSQTFLAPAETKVVTVLPGANTTWLKQFTILMGGTLYPKDSPIVTSENFPEGSDIKMKCSNCATALEEGEDWNVSVTFTESFLDPISFKVNGKIARHMGISANRDGTQFTGTGKWEVICPKCVSVTVAKAPATATPEVFQNLIPQGNASATPDPTQPGPTLAKITDASDGGAWWYTPVGGSCFGVSQNKSGTIPFGTPVTINKEFPGAGWTKYLGSKDMLLVDGDKCIFAGTIK